MSTVPSSKTPEAGTPTADTERKKVEQDDKKTAETARKAEDVKQSAPKTSTESNSGSTKTYKCETFSQLAVVVDGEVKARFQGFVERYQGEDRKVGYLETDDTDVQKILDEDFNVEEVSASEFKNSTDTEKKGVRPVPKIVF